MFYFSSHYNFVLYYSIQKNSRTQFMNYSYSEKILRFRDKKEHSFYKNIKLKTIQPQLRIKAKQKFIMVAKNPWGQAITSHQIDNLLTRLNDSPKILYSAIQHKNKQNTSLSTNKFKPLTMFHSMKHFTQNTNQTDKGTKKLPNVSTAKEQGAATEARLMKKIELAKKKYVQEYRKMLMEIKTINLDSDLPRIKYIEQNETSDRINMMHMGSKL